MSKLLTYSMVSIVIILITALILLVYEGNLKKAYIEATAKQTCKTSVKTHTLLKLRYADFSGEIKCPTVKMQINDNNENIAKKKIADALYDCWDQFGRGKLELFTDNSVYCTICRRITFGKDIKVNGVMRYLALQQAPRQKISYAQFLTTERTENSQILSELESKKIVDNIDASKEDEYAIIFTYIKGKDNLNQLLEKSKFAASGLGTVALGFGFVKAGTAVGLTGIGAPIAATLVSFGAFVMSVGTLWGFVGTYLATVPFEHISLISFVPYDAESLKSLNCKEIPIKQ